MIRISDLRTRDVVNIIDGKRLGTIKDIELDIGAGKVQGIILPGSSSKVMGIFGRQEDLLIPWEKIKTIGVDFILVELQNFTNINHEPNFRKD